MSLELNAYVFYQLDNANFADVRKALQNAGGGPITDHITGDDFVSYAITKVIPSHLTEATPRCSCCWTNWSNCWRTPFRSISCARWPPPVTLPRVHSTGSPARSPSLEWFNTQIN